MGESRQKSPAPQQKPKLPLAASPNRVPPSEGGNIQCVIEDNGVGRKQAKEFQERRSPLHKSFAAKATEERLNLLNYGRDNKIGVEIVDLYNENKEARGTKVILSIPIIKH